MEFASGIIVAVLMSVGSFFYVVGALGLIRMPDLFTRIHAASVIETVGAGAMLVGMMFAAGWSLDTVKLAIILGILLYTGPVATHALAQAALTAGVVPRLSQDRTNRKMKAVRRRPAQQTPELKRGGRS